MTISVKHSIIPYELDSVFSRGEGPHDSLIAYFYFYHEQKPDTIAKWVNELGCGVQETYPTEMDGIDGWSCKIWPGCQGGIRNFILLLITYRTGATIKGPRLNNLTKWK